MSKSTDVETTRTVTRVDGAVCPEHPWLYLNTRSSLGECIEWFCPGQDGYKSEGGYLTGRLEVFPIPSHVVEESKIKGLVKVRQHRCPTCGQWTDRAR